MTRYIGQWVIVRADRAGVFFGKLKNHSGNLITLQHVRKLYYWDGAAAVEEIAMIGTKNPNDCSFTVTVPEMEIADPVQIIPATDKAVEVIKSVPEWKA